MATQSEKSIVLITGANSGVGLELATQLLENESSHVLLGCRSKEKGEAAFKSLQDLNYPGTLELVILDVASEESITAAAKNVESKHGRLDVLVNNAAVAAWVEGSPKDKMMQCIETNAVGVYLMGEAFAPLLKKSIGTPRLINVTSGAGSVPRRLDPSGPGYNWGMRGIQYGASKAAMNLITATQTVTYGEEGIKVFAYSPGFVQSNLGPHNNAENGAKHPRETCKALVDILNGKRDGEDPRNGFHRETGQSPW